MDHRWFTIHSHTANGPVLGAPMSVAAEQLRPGDYLPPQACLDPTAWQDSGFRIGDRSQDVAVRPSEAPGAVLLFGPLGVLDFLGPDTVVDVVRSDA